MTIVFCLNHEYVLLLYKSWILWRWPMWATKMSTPWVAMSLFNWDVKWRHHCFRVFIFILLWKEIRLNFMGFFVLGLGLFMCWVLILFVIVVHRILQKHLSICDLYFVKVFENWLRQISTFLQKQQKNACVANSNMIIMCEEMQNLWVVVRCVVL
jgi:hypothetical protein